MNEWQDREDGDAVHDGWYAVLVFWGTPWEEDTPDVFRFKDGAWVQKQGNYCLPDFNYFQGPFQSPTEARNWGHAHDPATQFLAERAAAPLAPNPHHHGA